MSWTAVIPAAGLGKRMRVLTGGAPKEMLPLAGKPVLQWTIDEALAAGAQEVVVVLSEAKREVSELLSGQNRVRFAWQPFPGGMGHAVVCAECDSPVLVIVGDTLYWPESPLASLMGAVSEGADASVAVEVVGDSDVSQYGIVELNAGRAVRVFEKPRLGQTASRTAIAGRYALGPRAWRALSRAVEEHARPGGPEVGVTEVLAEAISSGLDLRAVINSDRQRRWDCGSIEGYETAKKALSQSLQT